MILFKCWQHIQTLCFLLLLKASCMGQSAIELENIRVLHAGIENPLTVIAEETPDSCLLLHVSAGTLLRYADGRYSWHDLPAGKSAELLVLDACGGDTLATRRYRVQALQIEALLSGVHRSKAMLRPVFMAQLGVTATLVNTDIDGRCLVHGFWATIVDGATGDTWMEYNSGGRFGESFLQRRALLKAGDVIRLSAIRFQCPGDVAPRFAQELVFIIK